MKKEYYISAIVLANYQPNSSLIQVLKSLVDQNYTKYEIILILWGKTNQINYSEIFKKYNINLSKVSIWSSKKDLGYALGNNLGVKQAKGEFIFIINPDTILPSNYLKKMMSSFLYLENLKKTDKIMLGPKICHKDNINGISRIEINFLGFSYLDSKKTNNIRKTMISSGCSFLIKKKYFDKLGGFNTDYFMYHDDTEFSYRSTKIGFSHYVDNSIHLWHIKSKYGYKMTKFKFFWWERNRLKFTLENSSKKIKMLICQLLMEPFMYIYAIKKGFLLEKLKISAYIIQNLKTMISKKTKGKKYFENYYNMEGILNEINLKSIVFLVLNFFVRILFLFYHN
ncbi:MAG: glycosyltransferase family 2 protein [Candidatus Hodarchaeota archaeon]